jgi:type III secretion protein V
MRIEEERALTEPAAREAQGTRFMPVVVRWSLEVSPDFAAQVRDDVRGSRVARLGFRSTTETVRETLFRELGVPLPACRVTVEPTLPPRHVVLAIREVPALRIEVPADEPVSPPAGRRPQTRLAPAEKVAADVLEVLRRRAAEFLGISETQGLLDRLEQVAPATVRQAVPKPIDVPLLSQVLRRLLEEQVSVRDLGAILEALCTAPSNERDPLTLAEHVRSELRHALAHRLTNGRSELQVILLDSAIEETIRGAVSKTQAGSFLTLAPAACRDIVAAVARARSELPNDALPAILTQPDIRRFVRKLVETDLPDLKVISFAELLPEVSVRPLGRARI